MEMSESLTDSEVVQLVQQSNLEVFDVLVRRYQARMRATVAHYVADREDVFDIVQDSFLEAFRSIDAFEPERDFLPWLRSICHHRTIDHLRRTTARYRAVKALLDEGVQERATATSEPHDKSLEKIRALNRCFHKLGQKHQRLIHLRYHAKVAVKDMAHQLGQSAASVSALLYRIRTMLAKCIERELIQGDGR